MGACNIVELEVVEGVEVETVLLKVEEAGELGEQVIDDFSFGFSNEIKHQSGSYSFKQGKHKSKSQPEHRKWVTTISVILI